MIAANRLTVTYAKALLAATPKEQLAEPEKPKSIGGVSAEALARMEQEMDHLQRDYRLIEDGYGAPCSTWSSPRATSAGCSPTTGSPTWRGTTST